MGFWPLVKGVLKSSDIVLVIADARMPDISINSELERLINMYRKEAFLVFTKCDLVNMAAQKQILENYPGAFLVSGVKNKGVSALKREVLILAKRMRIEKPRVGFVGYPNVGKSALINAMAKREKAPVSSTAGTTRGIHWITAGSLRILDTPGVIPYDDKNVKLGILGAKNIEKIKAPDRVAGQIISIFLAENPKALEEHYKITIPESKDVYDTFLAIGKRRGFLKKGGEIDEMRTAVTIVLEWQRGKLGFYSKGSSAQAQVRDVHTEDSVKDLVKEESNSEQKEDKGED